MNSIDKGVLNKLSGKLKKILQAELRAGNTVVKASEGDWPEEGSVFVMLDKPFRTPIQRNSPGIAFTNVNDPHYWKAEYHDKAAKQILACGFGGRPNFSEL